MNQILSLVRKELKTYFGSPMAAIFIGTFLLATMFSFFWVETFFARNIADIRPLFRWMPMLLVFLVAALTMRQWSEEQKMGTLEILLTLPVKFSHLVLGKFLAVLALVGLALALTFGLPVTVSLMGNIDWGPVIGGYLGALLMAAAYITIGLFISSRTDNQIISLILTVLLAGSFYLIGSSGITDFMGNRIGELLRLLGTGSRFTSIERGVLDLRDVVYYGSLALFFLGLNVVSLDRKRWSFGDNTRGYRRAILLTMALVAANLLAVNVWLDKVPAIRLDLTENQQYSISQVSRDLITNLNEPLLLRGYFSEKTHPLLAPLVPRIKDLLLEYEIAADGRIVVDFVDPKEDEELEIEANQQFGIKPVAFQIAGRYEASVVNSYFHILIKYGDQYVTLGFDELIEIERHKSGQLDVRLRNLEYDITKSIKKVVYGFQSLAAVFENIKAPLHLVAVVTPGTLPESLADLPARIKEVAVELQKEAGGKLGFTMIDPDDAGELAAGNGREQVGQRYNIEPLAMLFSPQTFFLHLLMEKGDAVERIYLGGDMSAAEIRQEIEAVLKRNAAGFLKTVGYVTPAADLPPSAMTGYPPPQPQESYTFFRQLLEENYNLKKVDLKAGRVEGDVDVLLLLAPQEMSDLERLAVDQFLMRGGAVVALAGRYVLDLKPYSNEMEIKQIGNGLEAVLADYGVTVGDGLVMDVQNEPLPIPVTRDLGGIRVREIQRMSFPFFVDVRSNGMDEKSPMVAKLPAVTMNWVSPLTLAAEKNKDRQTVQLLSSSPDSWVETTSDIRPDYNRYPGLGFAKGDSLASRVLAVSIKGVFKSYFNNRPDPRVAAPAPPDLPTEAEGDEAGQTQKLPPPPIIRQSPDSARLVVVGSSEFLHDAIIAMSQSMGGDRYRNNLEFLQNMVDWAVEDEELLSIRSRGANVRLLAPMTRKQQSFWEWLNYGIALLALGLVSVYTVRRRQREKPMAL